MKVLVTGATGLIGKRVVKRLLLRGHEVTVLSRNPQRALEELGMPVRAFAWDAMQGPPSPEAVAEVDAVLHLAGEGIAEGRWNADRKRRILESRTIGTRNLLGAFAGSQDRKPAVWVNASAIGIYGDRGNEALTEASAAGGGFLSEVCQAWEAEAARAESLGMRRVTVRIGIVLSEAGGLLSRLIPIFRSGLGGPLGNGQQWMSWIQIDDLVDLLVEAVENPQWQGDYNAVAPEPATNAQFASALGRALGRSAWIPAPATAIRAAMGEMSELALGSQKVLPRRAQEAGFVFRFPSLAAALEALCTPEVRAGDQVFETYQWVPKPVEEIWEFFTAAENLETITPPWLGFKILRKSTDSVQQGSLIDYRISIHGVPARWRTLIDVWEPNVRFVDTQLQGPYAKWHHTHTFEAMKGGTLLGDRVLYRLPVGSLGKWFAGSFVRNDIEKIFRYRREVISKKFG